MEEFAQRIQSIEGSPLVKQAFNDIFFMSSIDNVSFNSTLANLFGLNSEVHDFTLNFDAKGIFEGEKELNYFKCVQIELLNSFTQNAPFFLNLIISMKKINDSQFKSPKYFFSSEQENFYFFKKRVKYCAIEDIDFKIVRNEETENQGIFNGKGLTVSSFAYFLSFKNFNACVVFFF